MYILLHGAFKNVGDFIIFDRAKRLLESQLPGPFTVFNRKEPLDGHLEQVNAAKAVILCGGPGYGVHFYPGLFPLTSPLSQIKVPILPLGLGWQGQPMNAPGEFRFSPESHAALRSIAGRVPQIGCRDVLSLEVLRNAGFDTAEMVGCPAWYDLPSIGKAFQPPREIARLVFTPPQNVRLRWQAVQVMRRLKELFPRAERSCVFHRGWERDANSRGWRDVASNQVLRVAARGLGYRPVNAAYHPDKIEFYRDCDLHVGYRVHAHLFFLSVRKPSVLISEDGRGTGVARTFQLPDPPADREDVPAVIEARMRGELDTGFERFHQVCAQIDSTHRVMNELIQTVA